MPIEKVIDKAKINRSSPLNCANNFVLYPIIRQIAKIVSAAVAIIAMVEIKKLGIQGFIICVYFKNASQFPQEEYCSLHIPNLSATADKNPDAIASLKNSLIIFSFITNTFHEGS